MQESGVEAGQIVPSLFVLTTLTSMFKHRKEIMPLMRVPISLVQTRNL